MNNTARSRGLGKRKEFKNTANNADLCKETTIKLLRYLEVRKQVVWWPIADPDLDIAGFPDICVVKRRTRYSPVRVIFLEFKTRTRTSLTPHQKQLGHFIGEDVHILYCCTHRIEDIRTIFGDVGAEEYFNYSTTEKIPMNEWQVELAELQVNRNP